MGKLKLIIRDDDTNYFTDPSIIDAAYQILFEKNKAICLSLIPAHLSSIEMDMHGRPRNAHADIPEVMRNKRAYSPIYENWELSQFLIKKRQSRCLEFVLHGYAHTADEFVTSYSVAQQLLEEGVRLLGFIDGASPSVFVAPYDRLSVQATQAVLENGYHLCTSHRNLIKYGVLDSLSQHLVAIIDNDYCRAFLYKNNNVILTSDRFFYVENTSKDACYETQATRLQQALDAAIPFYIVTNHYWQFSSHEPQILEAWLKYSDLIVNCSEIEIVTFSELISAILESHTHA